MTRFQRQGDRISLLREIPSRFPFGKPRMVQVPVGEWQAARPDAAASAVSRLTRVIAQGWVGRDGAPLAEAAEDDVRFHSDLIARLTDGDAGAFGFPQATGLALTLRVRGLIHRDGFRIESEWTRSNGSAVNARRTGVWLSHNQAQWRIAEPLWTTLNLVETVNEAVDEAGRYAAVAELKRHITHVDADQIHLDRILDRLSLQYASGFSLAIKMEPQGVSFDPILLADGVMPSVDRSAPPDLREAGLLAPGTSAEFAMRFRQGDGSRQSYLLRDGTILYISPDLANCLRVVRRAQGASVEERLAFAAAPARHLMEMAGPAGGTAKAPFIETADYSDQLAQVEIWRQAVVPWVKPAVGSWIAKSFGLRIGDGAGATWLTIAGDRIDGIETDAQRAVLKRNAGFTIDGTQVPATQATLHAIESLRLLHRDASREGNIFPSRELAERNFLHLDDGGDVSEFAPLAVPEEMPVVASASLSQMPDGVKTQWVAQQKAGVDWLIAHWQAHTPGALLADEAGLGKSWQALAFIAWTRQFARSSLPVLIVGPDGFEENWQDEIDRHLQTGCIGPVTVLTRHDLMTADEDCAVFSTAMIDGTERQDPGVVLTSYECLRDYQMVFARQRFSTIVYDQAHILRHSGSQLTRAAKSLNARFQLALTATPIRERFEDLGSLLDVVQPGATETQLRDPAHFASHFKKLLAGQNDRLPIVMRRTADEFAILKDGLATRVISVEMPDLQAAAYERTVHRALAAKGTDHRARMLQLLRTLDAICLHPVLAEDAGSDPDYFQNSARFIAMFRILDELHAKHERALVLCDNEALHPLLTAEISRRYDLSGEIGTIDSTLRGKDARQIAANFEDRSGGFDVLVSTTESAAQLRLPSVEHVILLTRWWDLAAEQQAIASARSLASGAKTTVHLPQARYPDPEFSALSLDEKLHAFVEERREAALICPQPEPGLAEAEILFNEVIFEPVEQSSNDAPDEEPTPAQTAPPSRRSGTLSIAAISQPSPALPVRRDHPRRVVYQPGGGRNLDIFFGPLEEEEIASISIVDPYSAAGVSARRRTVDFVARLVGKRTHGYSVKLVSYCADGVGTYEEETNREQMEDMHRQWERQFGDLPLSFRPETKYGNRRLHDRSIEVRTVSGRTLIWDMGRGIDGVMKAHHQCTVIFTEIETHRRAA